MMLRNFDDIALFVMPILNRYIMFGGNVPETNIKTEYS
jgi:hypothetical protein